MAVRPGAFLTGKGGFILLSTLAFAACLFVSDYGTATHLRWLNGWPPLLFIFIVPPEYRWRFTRDPWVREVFVAMTAVSAVAVTVSALAEALLYRPRADHPPPWSDLVLLIPVVAVSSLLFGALALFSAWGLYSVFYRPGGPVSRRRAKPPRP